MSQQVKPGDLAVIVHDGRCPENLGAVVLVGRYLPVGTPKVGVLQYWVQPDEQVVVVTTEGRALATENLVDGKRYVTTRAYDVVCLRPLRDTDGEDEILRIAGKPEQFQHARFMPLGEK